MNEDWNRVYGDQVEGYHDLAAAAEYALRGACRNAGLQKADIAEVSHRVKERASLEEKAVRKGYASPLAATDIVGARIVYRYRADATRVENAVLSVLRGTIEAGEIEKVDHADTSCDKSDDLGYRACHFVGKLDQSGLSLVETVPVEIQVRTVGQHAWALLEEGLVYKTKSAVPQHLVRSVLGLSILFELADERFDQLRRSQQEYGQSLAKAEGEDLARAAVDLDSMKVMLLRAHKLSLGAGSDPELSLLLQDLDTSRFRTIGDIDVALRRTIPIAREFLKSKSQKLESPVRERLELALGLALADPELIEHGWPRGMGKADQQRLSAMARRCTTESGL